MSIRMHACIRVLCIYSTRYSSTYSNIHLVRPRWQQTQRKVGISMTSSSCRVLNISAASSSLRSCSCFVTRRCSSWSSLIQTSPSPSQKHCSVSHVGLDIFSLALAFFYSDVKILYQSLWKLKVWISVYMREKEREREGERGRERE